MEWILDVLLVVLLTVTLVHAIRLERALGVLKRDRSALETLVASFNASTRAAEAGIERLRAAADGSGQEVQRRIDTATIIKDDLTFLVQRGEGLADRLDETLRAARPLSGPPLSGPTLSGPPLSGPPLSGPTLARQAYPAELRPSQMTTTIERATREPEPKVRSQAERDLLKALRMVR